MGGEEGQGEAWNVGVGSRERSALSNTQSDPLALAWKLIYYPTDPWLKPRHTITERKVFLLQKCDGGGVEIDFTCHPSEESSGLARAVTTELSQSQQG